jgi:tetratricopeptide (TPR) repeat protein
VEQSGRPTPGVRRGLADTYHELALVQRFRNQPDDALRWELKSLAAREELVKVAPDDSATLDSLATSHYYIGVFQRDLGRPAEALRSLERAMTIEEAQVRIHPLARYEEKLGGTYVVTALLQRETGNLQEAAKYYGTALEMYGRVVQANPSVTRYRQHLAVAHYDLGHLQRELKDLDAAVASYDAARAQWERLAAEHTDIPLHRVWVDMAILGRAMARATAGDHEGATAEAETVARRQAKGRPTTTDCCIPADVADVYALASAAASRDPKLSALERQERAERYAKRAVASLKEAAATGWFETPLHLNELRTDKELDSLRQRDDFQKLLKDLEPKPAAKGQ